MAGDVEHIVDAAKDPEISIVVALGSVAGKVKIGTAGPFREIGLDVTLVVAPDRAQHRWPWFGDGEQTSTDVDSLAGRIEQVRGVAREGFRRAARFGGCDSGQR